MIKCIAVLLPVTRSTGRLSDILRDCCDFFQSTQANFRYYPKVSRTFPFVSDPFYNFTTYAVENASLNEQNKNKKPVYRTTIWGQREKILSHQ